MFAIGFVIMNFSFIIITQIRLHANKIVSKSITIILIKHTALTRLIEPICICDGAWEDLVPSLLW